MKPLIYSVEDDLNIQKVIKIALQNSNYEVKTFADGMSLFKELKYETPDLFLLDIMLPDMDGLQIISKIKELNDFKTIPIIIISAKASEIDKVTGLDLGADDYLIKPFGVLELLSRIKALLRRYKSVDEDEIMYINNLELNNKNFECFYKKNKIELTKKQFELLKFFMHNRDKTLKRDEIIKNVWDYEFIGESRSLDVHIKNLRKKLKNAGIKDEIITTIRGIGYKFIL